MTDSNKKLKNRESTLNNKNDELLEKVAILEHDQGNLKTSHSTRESELQLQVDMLQNALTTHQSARLTQGTTAFDKGYLTWIKYYMNSTFEKIPDLDWLILGDDSMAIVTELVGCPIGEEEAITVTEKGGAETTVTSLAVHETPEVVVQHEDLKDDTSPLEGLSKESSIAPINTSTTNPSI